MTNEERLTFRARQLLEDPTLSPNQRLPNARALLRQLALNVEDDPVQRASLLAEITDPTVSAAMDAALDTVLE